MPTLVNSKPLGDWRQPVVWLGTSADRGHLPTFRGTITGWMDGYGYITRRSKGMAITATDQERNLVASDGCISCGCLCGVSGGVNWRECLSPSNMHGQGGTTLYETKLPALGAGCIWVGFELRWFSLVIQDIAGVP